jgi:glycosyltransferase involved in cell wall biosynthesis
VKIVISAGGRFHAFHLAQQLAQRNALAKFFTFSYTSNDQKYVPARQVKNINSCMIADFAFTKLRLSRLFNKTSYNVFKDNLFDRHVQKEVSHLKNFDLFVGWAHYALKSLHAARLAGATIIIESGSCHILEQQKLLQEEYALHGLTYPPIHEKTVAKMLQEYAQTDYIMTLSEFSYQSFIKQGICEKKLLKIPCGFDVEFFEKKPETTIALESLKITRKKFRVIFVGLISLRKGVQYLLDAWIKLNLPEHETELVLVGVVQQDFQKVYQRVAHKKNIIFYGSSNRETLRTLYHSSSIFVLPSIEDGFGMVIGEAMASGLPVICTTNTGAPDIITTAEHGFIVPIRNADALAEKISWCYTHQDSAAQMGAAGKIRVKEFTWDAYGERVFETYHKIVSEK